ncbi:MAG: hypothetical protein RLZZ546_1979 [Bacteroidota bacterium]|jgi:uncharacterized YccA/Bax inhibitor family protein
MSNFFKSRNPIVNEKAIAKTITYGNGYQEMDDVTTVEGAINKSLILFGILMLTATISFMMPSSLLLIAGGIGGFIAVLVSSFKPHTSPIAAPVYAAFEGLFIGTLSAMYGAMFQGIVLNAASLTLATLLLMLLLYKYKVIKVTQKLRAGIMIATAAIFVVYLISFILRLFHINVPYIHQGGAIGIGFSVFVIGLAAMNLLLDFDNFEEAARQRAPKYMEWFCGLGLLVTVVWLYIEFLRLLAKLREE